VEMLFGSVGKSPLRSKHYNPGLPIQNRVLDKGSKETTVRLPILGFGAFFYTY